MVDERSLTMNQGRRAPHRRPAKLEAWLARFERLLGPLELRELEGAQVCDEPILCLMGCARSGSTLVFQYLARAGMFTYPTNFLSRFYYAPYIGAQLQEMLYGADFRGEVVPGSDADAFNSDLGKTRGPLAPHEFWYFWRRFFNFGVNQQLSASEVEAADWELFLRELRAMQGVRALPLLLKGMILNWNIADLASLWERLHFIFVRRDVAANADSLVRARRRFFGDESRWYSFKPPGFEATLELDARQQAAWQVLATNATVEQSLARLPVARSLEVDYGEFCADPAATLRAIGERWGIETGDVAPGLPRSFEATQHQEKTVNWKALVEDVKERFRLPESDTGQALGRSEP
ncbi:MAG: sulfotransferase [Woeseiaceae bacterium]